MHSHGSIKNPIFASNILKDTGMNTFTAENRITGAVYNKIHRLPPKAQLELSDYDAPSFTRFFDAGGPLRLCCFYPHARTNVGNAPAATLLRHFVCREGDVNHRVAGNGELAVVENSATASNEIKNKGLAFIEKNRTFAVKKEQYVRSRISI
jgi:hypothetical protein